MQRWVLLLALFCGFGSNMLFPAKLYSQDSTNTALPKPPKNYIRPCIYGSMQVLPYRQTRRAKSHENMGYLQLNLGFYTPLLTSTWETPSGRMPSFQWLLTGNWQYMRANFSVSDKSVAFSKLTLGTRFILNDGYKSIWMFYFSPFLSNNIVNDARPNLRFSAMILYNRTVSDFWSYQIGINRTYLYGRAFLLPILGVRIGKLDKFHVQLALPRNVSFNLPLSPQVLIRLYSRVNGGVYNIRNFDTAFTDLKNKEILFGISELNTGFETTYNPSRTISLNLGLGVASRRKIGFYENSTDIGGNWFNLTENFQDLPAAFFLNAGVAIRLGKARNNYNQAALQDAMELNSLFDPGETNQRVAGSDRQAPQKESNLDKMKANQLRDLKEYFVEE